MSCDEALKIAYGYHPLLEHPTGLERTWPFDVVPRTPGHEAIKIYRGENPFMQPPPTPRALAFSCGAADSSRGKRSQEGSARGSAGRECRGTAEKGADLSGSFRRESPGDAVRPAPAATASGEPRSLAPPASSS